MDKYGISLAPSQRFNASLFALSSIDKMHASLPSISALRSLHPEVNLKCNRLQQEVAARWQATCATRIQTEPGVIVDLIAPKCDLEKDEGAAQNTANSSSALRLRPCRQS